jgi:hypothetical protein
MNRIAHYLSHDATRRYSGPIRDGVTPAQTMTTKDGTELRLVMIWTAPSDEVAA